MRPEFHIGDSVCTTKGQAFVVTGIMKGAAGLMYCGASTQWTGEEDLDYDVTSLQREALVPVENMVHNLRTNAADLSARLVLLKEAFDGRLPPTIITELDAVILMLRSHIEL